MEVTIVALVYAALFMLGGGGLLFWIRRQFKAMQGTIDAMKSTIEGQRQHIKTLANLADTLKGVLESTDEPKMLERLKAYKEFVDREAEARIKDAARGYQDTATDAAEETAKELLKEVGSLTGAIARLVIHLAPYVPPDRRTAILNSVDFPPTFRETKDVLVRGMTLAPDASRGLARLLWEEVSDLLLERIARRARVASPLCQ